MTKHLGSFIGSLLWKAVQGIGALLAAFVAFLYIVGAIAVIPISIWFPDPGGFDDMAVWLKIIICLAYVIPLTIYAYKKYVEYYKKKETEEIDIERKLKL